MSIRCPASAMARPDVKQLSASRADWKLSRTAAELRRPGECAQESIDECSTPIALTADTSHNSISRA